MLRGKIRGARQVWIGSSSGQTICGKQREMAAARVFWIATGRHNICEVVLPFLECRSIFIQCSSSTKSCGNEVHYEALVLDDKNIFPFICPCVLCSLCYAEAWKVVLCSVSLRYSWTCRLPSYSFFIHFLSNKYQSINQDGKRKWEDSEHALECCVFGKKKNLRPAV